MNISLFFKILYGLHPNKPRAWKKWRKIEWKTNKTVSERDGRVKVKRPQCHTKTFGKYLNIPWISNKRFILDFFKRFVTNSSTPTIPTCQRSNEMIYSGTLRYGNPCPWVLQNFFLNRPKFTKELALNSMLWQELRGREIATAIVGIICIVRFM